MTGSSLCKGPEAEANSTAFFPSLSPHSTIAQATKPLLLLCHILPLQSVLSLVLALVILPKHKSDHDVPWRKIILCLPFS
jgi:hypothetical protein